MTFRALSMTTEPLDPRTAPRRLYRAGHNGRTITAVGPERVYPSGLAYYRIAGSTEYIPASELQWISPVRDCRERITHLARRRFTVVKD